MKMHANARLSLKGRELLVDRVENAGWSLMSAAEAAGISDRTARKWIARHRGEGHEGLLDRSSAPVCVANRTDERRVEVIAALRRIDPDRRTPIPAAGSRSVGARDATPPGIPSRMTERGTPR